MRRYQDPKAIQPLGRCLLCESAERPPAAVCHRCGAFVCREHAIRLVHRLPRTLAGLMASRAQEKGTRLEMVCEVCYLNDLAYQEQAV